MVKNKTKKLKENEVLQVRSDTLMHDLINEKEMDTIEWLVMQILDCSYADIHGNVTVNNIRLPRTNRKERNKYVDLVVTYNQEKVIVELNQHFDGVYVRNFLFGMNQLLNNYSLGSGNYYKEITRVIVVNLNWYDGNIGMKIVPKKIYEIPYSDDEGDGYLFKMINVNLDYYSKVCYDKLDVKDKLYKLLTIKNKDELLKITKQEKMLDRYSKKLIDLSSDDNYVEGIMSEEMEEFIEQHTMYRNGLKEGISQGIEKGIEQGIEQGTQEKQKEIILNMFNDKVSLEVISKYTNLTIQEIEEIINSNK